MSAAEETPRLPSPAARLHEANARIAEITMALANREPRPRSLAYDCEVGQEARTKEWLVKSLQVPGEEGESAADYAKRIGDAAKAIAAELPAGPITITPAEAKRRMNAKPPADAVSDALPEGS